MATTLLEAANVRIERIISHGHASPLGFWYDQDQHEWIVVLKRPARLCNCDSVFYLGGDHTGNYREPSTNRRENTIWRPQILR
jgi:cupin 2 domain-containing protein